MLSSDSNFVVAVSEVPSPVSPIFRPIWARMMMNRMKQVEDRLTVMEQQRQFEREVAVRSFFTPEGGAMGVDSILQGARLPRCSDEELRKIKDRAIAVEHWEFAHAALKRLAEHKVISEGEKLQMLKAEIHLDPLEALKVIKEQIPAFPSSKDRASALVLQVEALKAVSRDLSRTPDCSVQSRSVAKAGINKGLEILRSSECPAEEKTRVQEFVQELRYLAMNRVFAWFRNMLGR